MVAQVLNNIHMVVVKVFPSFKIITGNVFDFREKVVFDWQAAWGEVDFVICDMFLTYIRHTSIYST